MAFADVYTFTGGRQGRTDVTLKIQQDGFAGTADTINVKSANIKPSSVNDRFKTGLLDHILEIVFFDEDYTNNGSVYDTLSSIDQEDWRIVVNFDGVGDRYIGRPEIRTSRKGYYDGKPEIRLDANLGGVLFSNKVYSLADTKTEFYEYFETVLQDVIDADILFNISWVDDSASGLWRPDLLRINGEDVFGDLSEVTYQDVIDRLCDAFDLQICFQSSWFVREINSITDSSQTYYRLTSGGSKNSFSADYSEDITSSDVFFEPQLGHIPKAKEAEIVNSSPIPNEFVFPDSDFSEWSGGNPVHGWVVAGSVSDPGTGIELDTTASIFAKEGDRVLRNPSVDETGSTLSIDADATFYRDPTPPADGTYTIEWLQVRLIHLNGGNDRYLQNNGNWTLTPTNINYSYSVVSGSYTDGHSGTVPLSFDDTTSEIAFGTNDEDTYRLQVRLLVDGADGDQVNRITYEQVQISANDELSIGFSEFARVDKNQLGRDITRTIYVADRSRTHVGTLEYWDGDQWVPAESFNSNSYYEELCSKILERQQDDVDIVEFEYFEELDVFVYFVITMEGKDYVVQGTEFTIFGPDRLKSIALEINQSRTGFTFFSGVQ